MTKLWWANPIIQKRKIIRFASGITDFHNLKTTQENTAIIVFTRLAEEEVLYKKLGHSTNMDTKAVDLMITQSIRVAKSTGKPIFVCSSPLQKGTTFAERLSNAFQDVFDLGYDHVLAIGNDCISLDRYLLEQALQILQEEGITAGPTKDGGVYLLGMSRSNFDAAAFEALPWQTNDLFATLSSQLHRQLPVLTDIDDSPSLVAAINDLSCRPLFRAFFSQLKALVSPRSSFLTFVEHCIPFYRSFILRLRPPPQIFLSR